MGTKEEALDALMQEAAAAVRYERARIRRELIEWLVGDLPPEDAGIVAGRKIITEIDRICPKLTKRGADLYRPGGEIDEP